MAHCHLHAGRSGKLDQVEALMDSLPLMPLAPQTLYAALYQKWSQPEKAWEQARMQLMTGGQTVLQALAVLAASDAPEALGRWTPMARWPKPWVIHPAC